MEPDREQLRRIISQHFKDGDYTGWFETLYAHAEGDTHVVPWADEEPNRFFRRWLATHSLDGTGKRAVVVGCGLGDDAELLASLGFSVTAFDISESAIQWCKLRFPESTVDYQVANLFELPADWQGAFDFILEIYTVQALPLKLRQQALKSIAGLIAEEARLLLICWARDDDEAVQDVPWPLSRGDLAAMEAAGLQVVEFEDFVEEGGEIRRFRVEYQRIGSH